MKGLHFTLLGILLLTGCDLRKSQLPSPQDKALSLAEARQGFKTKLSRSESANEPVPEPPPAIFSTVRYESPAGKLAAYLTPDPKDGKKHPAIIWITGGDCNTIGEIWEEAPASNDQTAGAFRNAGIIMMFPSLRGGNDNPGVKEGFFGEVVDVLAAAEFLGGAGLRGSDPYLPGRPQHWRHVGAAGGGVFRPIPRGVFFWAGG